MSLGGSGSAQLPTTPVSAPKPARVNEISVTKAREDLRLRLRRASSRSGSNITGTGLLSSTLDIRKPVLHAV